MPTQTALIESVAGVTGTTAELMADGSSIALYTAASVATAKGTYTPTFTALVAAGTYRLKLFTSTGAVLATGLRVFVGTDGEIATTAPEPAAMSAASITAVQSGLATQASVNAIDALVQTLISSTSDAF